MCAIKKRPSLWQVAHSLWFNRQLRRYLVQTLFVGGLLLFVVIALSNLYDNLVRQGMAYGWDFLWRATGWKLSTSMLPQDLEDPYWWTILMGILNTLVLGLLCVICSAIVGCFLGLMRLSGNLMIRAVSTVYVDLLRNIPVIMQIFFWYAILRNAPSERQAFSLADSIFISNRGFYFPSIEFGSNFWAFLLVLLALIVLMTRHMERTWARHGATAAVIGAALLVAWQSQALTIGVPKLVGFGFRGGYRIPIEFLVLLIAITIYSSAYIAEIVRGGLLAVDRGVVEAGNALGLSEATVFWRIRFPLAMRSAIPPLSNQFLITMKITSLGAAIGFADLFSVTSTSINHAGQTIELLVVMMGSYLLINYVIASLMRRLNESLALKRNTSSAMAGSSPGRTIWNRIRMPKPRLQSPG